MTGITGQCSTKRVFSIFIYVGLLYSEKSEPLFAGQGHNHSFFHCHRLCESTLACVLLPQLEPKDLVLAIFCGEYKVESTTY